MVTKKTSILEKTAIEMQVKLIKKKVAFFVVEHGILSPFLKTGSAAEEVWRHTIKIPVSRRNPSQLQIPRNPL